MTGYGEPSGPPGGKLRRRPRRTRRACRCSTVPFAFTFHTPVEIQCGDRYFPLQGRRTAISISTRIAGV